MSTAAIQLRYEVLATSDCCISCGGAVGFAEPRPGQICVDLGSGRGNDTVRLAEKVGSDGHAYGIDITDAMLEKARRTAEKLGVENVTFLKGTLESLPLPDVTADWVLSNCVLNHATDKAATWREIARILKPGGRFVVSDIYAVGEIPEAFRNDPAYVAECWAGAVPREEYLATIAQAGLLDVKVLEESQPYEKGKATVASFTLSGRKKARCCS